MLIDSHCHLDFPELAADLDGVLARAGEPASGDAHHLDPRPPFRQIRAIVEAHENVFCSVGTHPHNAQEEPDITVEELVALARPSESRGDRRGGARLPLRQQSRATCRRRLPHAHRRGARTGLPLVIHAREADADIARILKRRPRRGPSPSCCIAFRAGGAGPSRPRARRLCVFLRRRHIQKRRKSLRDIARARARGSAPDRDRRALSRADADARQDQRAGLRRATQPTQLAELRA